MSSMKLFSLALLALCVVEQGLTAQVLGVGNGRDLRLRTAVGATTLNGGSKFFAAGNNLTINLDSPASGLVGMPALIVTDLRMRTDDSVLQVPGEPNALGVSSNFFFLVEGSGVLPAILPGVYSIPAGGLQFAVPMPDFAPFGPISVFLQGVTVDGGAPNGLAFTRTLRHDSSFFATPSTMLSATQYGNGTNFGYGLAVGDVNGDGFADVLSGMHYADPSGVADAGELRIDFGPTQATSQTLVAPTLQAGANFGNNVRVADVTGDNIKDIIVTARYEDSPGAVDAGAAYIFVGPSFTSSVRVTAPTPMAGTRFGVGVTTADWDGDGIKDVCIGAPRAMSTSGVIQAGKVYIFKGPTFTFLAAIDNPTPFTGDKFGDALIGADFNGDGLDDLFVGAPGRDSLPATDAGGAFLFLNGSLLPSVTLAQPPDTDAELGNGFSAADMNGDGFMDVVCGTEFADGPMVDSGQVQIIYGPSFSTRSYINSPLPSVLGGFGSASAAGDINRDGYPDLIVGEFYADIASFTDAGQGWVFLGPTYQQWKRFEAPDPATIANFGRRVAFGDLNGDGFAEVLFSAPLADPGGPVNNQEGSVYIFR